MSYTTNLEIQDEIIGKMGLGVDYYKGEKGEQGIPGKDGKDGSDQVYVGADEPTDERVKLWIDTDATHSSKTVSWDEIENKPNLADVATSGDYNDLSNKPTIPSIDGLASEAYVNEKVAAIVIPEVPTKVSELENDKGYLTEHQSLAEYAKTADLAQVAKTGSYNDLSNKPTIPSTAGLASTEYVDSKVGEIVIPTVPTNVSAFTNDAGYLTEHQSLADYSTTAQVQTMISSAIGAITNGNEVSY